MDEDNNIDWLEKALKKEEPYIDNNGFSQQVIESLPRRKRLSWRMKRRIVKGAVMLCGLATVLGVAATMDIIPEIQELLKGPMGITLLSISFFVAITGSCVWVSSDRA